MALVMLSSISPPPPRAGGVLYPGAPVMKRVVVFIDGQNFYRSARRAFFDDSQDRYYIGQFRPEAIGYLLAARDEGRTLREVRIYTGRPDAYLQPKAHSANVRQCAAWEAAGCYVFTRPLRYPPGFPNSRARRPEEKGIDVAMAVDLTRLAQDGYFDVAIVCTGDTDLIPAVEAVLEGGSGAAVEVPGGGARTTGSASAPGRNIWCHWLARRDYERPVTTQTMFSSDPPTSGSEGAAVRRGSMITAWMALSSM
jgi:uncharacterized LabA/DUF88 family protein